MDWGKYYNSKLHVQFGPGWMTSALASSQLSVISIPIAERESMIETLRIKSPTSIMNSV